MSHPLAAGQATPSPVYQLDTPTLSPMHASNSSLKQRRSQPRTPTGDEMHHLYLALHPSLLRSAAIESLAGDVILDRAQGSQVDLAHAQHAAAGRARATPPDPSKKRHALNDVLRFE